MTDKLITVLSIEEDYVYFSQIREILVHTRDPGATDAEFDIVWATDLAAGLERLADGEIDVVLLDLTLPDSEGLHTFYRVNAAAPEVPIVILTEVEDNELALQTVREGAQDYLVKGQISGRLLKRTLRFAVERKQLEAALLLSQQQMEISYWREQERRRLSDTLREVARIVSGTLEQQQVLDLMFEQLDKVVTYHYMTVMLLARGKLTRVAGRNKMGGAIEGSTILADQYPLNVAALRGNSPLLIPDLARDDRWHPTNRVAELRSLIIAPLLVQGNPIGLLNVGRSDTKPYTEDDAQTVFAFATQVAVALENARLYAHVAALNEELENFTYSITHNLHAPLRSLDGFSQVLLDDYQEHLNSSGQDYLHRIRAASQRLSQMIDELMRLLRFSRREMHREMVDLSALARGIAERLQRQDAGRQVKFIIAENVKVYGDAQMFEEVLQNLLDNAWKFTRERPRAEIEFGIIEHETITRDGKKTWYFVRDNGVGFDIAYADKLFAAFQRLHSESEFGGIGMGLAIVKRIVERHRGRVWAEGAEGRGAVFYFEVG